MRAAKGVRAPLVAERRRYDDEAQALVGGRCEVCGRLHWPRRAVCPECGSGDVDEAQIPVQGRLTTWTRVWVPIEHLEPPYLVGMVEAGGVLLLGHLRESDGDPRVSDWYRVVVDPAAVPPFWFVPVRDPEAEGASVSESEGRRPEESVE